MNIGGGRIILQDILRIDKSLKNGDFEKNSNFLKCFTNLKEFIF